MLLTANYILILQRIIICILINIVVSTGFVKGQTSDLSNKTVFKGEYPLTSNFRGNHNTETSYADFVKTITKAGRHIPDLIDLNIFYDTLNIGWANQMAHDYPDRLFLQVRQANGGIPRLYEPWPSSIDRICGLPVSFPGHWIVKPYTMLTSNITLTDTLITVQSIKGFTIGNYMPAWPDGCPALIVETDAIGNKNWNHYEYVWVTAVNGNKLTVTRAYRDSPLPTAFTSGFAEVAPILVDYTWNSPPVWYINMSPTCPQDANGKTASQVLQDDLYARFGPGGPLNNFSGVDYASGPFTDPPDSVDYNWDGIVDAPGEYITGTNTFLSNARNLFGNNFLFLTGNNNINYINGFNGLNNEGLVQPDDPWRRITNALNEDIYWLNNADSPRIIEETLRIQDDSFANVSNAAKWVQLTRMGNGYATCLGSCAALKDKIFTNATTDTNVVKLTWAELFKGTEDVEHWLGKPTSPPIHVASTTTNLLGDSVNDWSHMLQKLNFKNGTMAIEGNELVLTPNNNVNHTLSMSVNLTQHKDLTVLFDVRSGGNQMINIINNATLSLSYQTGADATTYYSNKGYTAKEFYWRGLDSSSNNCTISFNFKGTDPIRFRSLSVHEVPDAMARSFEHGVVLVNPGMEEMAFDLHRLFGTNNTYKRLSSPTVTVSPQWQQQYQQTLELNSGATIATPSHVVVPELNALFLISQPVLCPDTNAWIGVADTAWENPSNWACGIIPDSTTVVNINFGVPNYPTISSNAFCKTINITPGATITIKSGFNLNVMGKQ
ncbi:hypothetical protein LK994_04735 [Ferruginibacter lapsinanis]|uniref:hypothetical protein n=1 Tax=Ferruginibacter lapsinanis TaxID=563172 RepID=UPI001E32CE91|nr:hypothetical protein [Ferruginibacter lapsinanis]UEG50779.1 hypothetical protein LK994_04735 [Ferruginibacter lapsinanis]